jgi:hypothetical protein
MDMDTTQIELTNACLLSCSNCTRFCGHKNPYFIDKDLFKKAIDSMVGYPKMTGFMGGEPLLHPDFEEFCAYALTKIPKEKLGLWTCLPKGYEKYANTICNTFGNIFINDHTRNDIFHCPVLVASEEVIHDRKELFYIIDHCWLQNNWSASINMNGAFFCEIAAAMSVLFDGSHGWPIEQGWWWRTPKDFTNQIEEYCPKCGCCVPLPRRASTEGIDDISPGNLERIKGWSKKVAKGLYAVSNLKMVDAPQEMAAYKNMRYRTQIAARYGIALLENEKKFLTPYVAKNIHVREKSIFDEYKEQLTRST